MGTYKTGFKVVKKRSLTSAVISGKDCALKYKVNKWVKPIEGNGPLCVFNSIEDAEDLNYHMLDSIYECLYEESKENTIYIATNNEISNKKLENLPRGTVLATKVKLLRRIR